MNAVKKASEDSVALEVSQYFNTQWGALNGGRVLGGHKTNNNNSPLLKLKDKKSRDLKKRKWALRYDLPL